MGADMEAGCLKVIRTGLQGIELQVDAFFGRMCPRTLSHLATMLALGRASLLKIFW